MSSLKINSLSLNTYSSITNFNNSIALGLYGCLSFLYIFLIFTVLFFISQKFKEIAKIGNGAGVKKSGSDPERNEKIKKAHINYGYRLKEIGKYLGLHNTTVSRIVKK